MVFFSEAYLRNKLFLEQALAVNPMGAYPDGTNAGAFPQENGDVLVRLKIPGGKTASLNISVSNYVSAKVDLQPVSGDVFEGTIAYDPKLNGPANVVLTVNGAQVLTPDLPVIWTDNRPQNNIELPEKGGEYLMERDISHGRMVREMIASKVTGNTERCMIYLPPDYQESGAALPVLYLLHGGGDNELMWDAVGKMSRILDNLWADKNAVPFVTVMMNGMIRAGGRIGTPVDETFENMLLEDTIPFVESRYHVRTDKWNRAIAGLSMGAYMSCDIGFAHPELFGSIGTFTASMSQNPGFAAYERPYPKTLAAGGEAFAANYKLYWRSTTPAENHPEFFAADDELLLKAGIYERACHHRVLYTPEVSKWSSWRRGLYDFAQLVFQ